MKPFAFLPLLGLLACAPFPELGQVSDRAALAAPFPQLVPLDDLVSSASQMDRVDVPAPPATRIARLQARAAALRGAVIDPTTRARMRQGVSSPF